MAPVLELKIGELGEDFYDEEKAVISRLLERRNDGESRIADIYLARIGGPAAATAREKEKDKAKNRSPPKSRDESLDSGAASGHEGDKANQMNGHVESRLESIQAQPNLRGLNPMLLSKSNISRVKLPTRQWMRWKPTSPR